MTKIFKIIAFFVLLLSSSALKAQSFSLGGGLVYGDDVQQLGLHLRGYYNLKNEKVCFGPEYSNFFESTEAKDGESISKKLNEFNFNIHYVFELNETIGFYPLTGLNFSTEREEIEIGTDFQSITKDAFGVNLGFGFHKLVGRSVVFIEYDHLFSELSQNSALIGFFYNLNKKEKHEE